MCPNVFLPRTHAFKCVKIIVLLLLMTTNISHCLVPIDDFYPFGVENNDTANPKKDDDGSGAINLTRPFYFYGKSHDIVHVSILPN